MEAASQRLGLTLRMSHPKKECVWDYPCPPRIECVRSHVQVVYNGEVIADSQRALRVLTISHPPNYYFPRGDVRLECLRPSAYASTCEWKGIARYFDVVVCGRQTMQGAWTFPAPEPGYELLAGHYAFFPSRMDACFVDGQRVVAQPGDAHGGWVTDDVLGPFGPAGR